MTSSQPKIAGIIPASSIDYRNVDEICGYQMLLCKLYECEGGLNLPAKSTPITREISRQALIWLREVKSLIASILDGKASDINSEASNLDGGAAAGSASLASIPSLLSGYDMLHRIAHGFPCFDYLREVKCKTADRWLKGDKSISKTDVVLLLLSETYRDILTLEKRYAQYSIKVMSSWIDELQKNGTFPGIPPSETYRRLSYLLGTDLFVYLGSKEQAKVKSQWVKSHLLTETRLDELDTATLWDYAHFIVSIPFSTPAQYERNSALYKHILSKIALRHDTHPYAAKAIELAIARYEALSA